MKKLLGIFLSLVLTMGALVGCESQEDYENRVIGAVQERVEEMMSESVTYVNITDREWTYHKTENGEEYVQMSGILVYGYSTPMTAKFYVDTKEGYITRLVTDSIDEHYDDFLPKNDRTKLDL